MSNFKIKRIKDEKLLKSYHFEACYTCGETQGICAHHIKTKKSGGHDIPQNLIPLCFDCHAEIHSVGLTEFCFRHVEVQYFLIEMGWEFSEYRNKWINPAVGIN